MFRATLAPRVMLASGKVRCGTFFTEDGLTFGGRRRGGWFQGEEIVERLLGVSKRFLQLPRVVVGRVAYPFDTELLVTGRSCSTRHDLFYLVLQGGEVSLCEDLKGVGGS